VTPAEVVKAWKAHLPEFMPANSRFYPPVTGIRPGEVVLINANLPGVPTPVSTGVMVAQIQSLARANDPIYEFGFRFLGGSRQQERIWRHVLARLAAHFGVTGEAHMQKVCVDSRLQWSQARNVWHNALIRTAINTPARMARNLFGRL